MRARAWRDGVHRAVCDVVEPWAHGVVVRATRCPSFFEFNLVRVFDEPGMSVSALSAFADSALDGLAHRRIDFDDVVAGGARRAELTACGWSAVRLVWMRHSGAAGEGPDVAVSAVPYEAVHELRVAWHREEGMAEVATADFYAQARGVAAFLGAEVLAVLEGGVPVAFAQLERRDGGAEITNVFVSAERRGRGLGTALTRAAIRAAGDVADLWICADDEARAKDLYARLGFRPVWRSMEVTRLP